MGDRLYRSSTDRVIAGVAGGLASWLRIDPSIVRVAWVVLAVISGGIFLLVVLRDDVRRAAGASRMGAERRACGCPRSAPAAGRAVRRMVAAARGPVGLAAAGRLVDAAANGRARMEIARSGNAGIVFGFILVGLGVWFLLDQYVHIDGSSCGRSS